MKKSILFAAGILAGALSAQANQWAFESTSEYGPQELRLQDGGGTWHVFSTSDSELTPGVANQGWWSENYYNSDWNDNYFAGWADIGYIITLNNFFSFDLANFNANLGIQQAQLALRQGFVTDPATYRLFDVSTDVATLNYNEGTSLAIFNDLGSGTSYGSFAVAPGDYDNVVVFDLNAAAIGDILEAAGGWFSVGGTLTDAQAPVPEVQTYATAVGALLMGAQAWRSRRRKA